MRFRLFLLFLASLAAGCGGDSDPYNRLEETRILALRADPPLLLPGETATLDALVYLPADDDPTYEWSWCPLRAGGAQDFACVLSAEELGQRMAEAGFPLVIDYSLGSAPEATLSYLGTPGLLSAICAALTEGALPTDIYPPSCEQGLPLSVQLVVRTAGRVLRADKEVILLFDASQSARHNPSITGMRAGLDPCSPENASLWLAETPYLFERGEAYDLFAEVPEEAAEIFTPQPSVADPQPTAKREMLFITWFAEGGETDKTRSTFLDGEIDFTRLLENGWVAPHRDEYAPDTVRFLFVIRDEHGGVGWLSRTAELVGE